ncbi:MAG: lysostaphin resistance A-like protein [Candidatus Thorarchaeota archaeon]
MEGEALPRPVPSHENSRDRFLKRCLNRILFNAKRAVLLIKSFRLSIIRIIGKPWIVSVLVIYLGVSVLWIVFYDPSRWIPQIFLNSAFLLSILALWELRGGAVISSSNVSPRVTLVTVLWWFIWISFAYGGYTLYFHEVIDNLVFYIALTLMPLLLIWATGIHIRKRDLGLTWNRLEVSLFFILLGFLWYGTFIIGELVSVDVSYATGDDISNLLVSTTLLPAVFEEITIRGILQGQLTKHTKSRLSGVFLSALVFGAGHLLSNPSYFEGDLIAGLLFGFLAQFLGGLVYGGIYALTGSILATSTLHYLNNFSSWLVDKYKIHETASTLNGYGMGLAIFIAVVLIGLSLLSRLERVSVSGLAGSSEKA